MMKKFVFLASVLGALVTVAPASAQVVLDFEAGLSSQPSGTCTVSATAVTCTGINVGVLTVSGDGKYNGQYLVDSGSLSYTVNTSSPGSDSLTIFGSVDCIGGNTYLSGSPCFGAMTNTEILSAQTLLTDLSGGSGTISDPTPSTTGQITLSGSDEKAQTLLSLLGISTSSCSGGFCTGWALQPATFDDLRNTGGTTDPTYQSYSYDVSDTAVPEPTSVLLLGSVLFGVTGLMRRRAKKA